MTDNATFLRQSLQFLLAEQKKTEEAVRKTVSEIKSKYQRWASDTPTDENSFMEIKRDIDDASRMFHGSTRYINGNGVLQEVEARRNLQSLDVNALILRIQVVEKAMSGYQKDNDDVKSKLSTIDRKIDDAANTASTEIANLKAASTTASTEIANLKAADTKLDQSLGSLKATTEKELKDHAMRLSYIDSVKTFIQEQPGKDASQDKELAKLKEDASKLTTSLTELHRNFETNLADLNASLSILGHNDNQLNIRTQELDRKTNEMQDNVNDIWGNLRASDSRIEESARETLILHQNVDQLSDKVRVNSIEITKLESSNRELEKLAANLQQEIVRLQTLGHEERLQKVQKQYSAMENLVKTVSREFYDYISGRSAIGFTASPCGLSKMDVTLDQIIKFQSVAFNACDHYDKSTGIFTAPRSGLYYTSVTISTLNAGRVNVAIKHRSLGLFQGCRKVVSVSRTSSKVEDISCTGAGVVHMEAGDELYAMPVTVTGDAVLSCYSSFSCFLLS